jgi:hypothetical protein
MKAWTRLSVAVTIAIALTLILLHGLVFLLDDAASKTAPSVARAKADKGRAGKARTIATRLQSKPRTDVAQRDPPPSLPKKPKPEEEKPKPVEEPDGQIVETARPETEERPLEARYLGRYDMKVAREQKSQGKKRQGRDLGHRQIENPSELQSPTSKSDAPTQIAAPKSTETAERRPKAKAQRAVAKRAEAAPPSPTVGPQPAHTAAAVDGPGPSPGGSPSDAPAHPSVVRGAASEMLLPATSPGNILHNLQALAGNPGSDDYLPDVTDEGDTNLLNTRKFRYWDFFQRVRERVRHEWDPTAVWRARDPSGKRYGVRDRLTIVRVTLGAEGDVRALRIKKPSGLGFLDEEASRAFFAGGPYPNPPAGLVNARGEVEFQFGFMFEISSSRFRFYRVDR